MTIFVKTLTNKTVTITDIYDDDTVDYLKSRV